MSEEAQWIQDTYKIKDAIKVLKTRAHITDRDIEAIQKCCDNKGWLFCEDFVCKYYLQVDRDKREVVDACTLKEKKNQSYSTKVNHCRYSHDWSWIDCERYKPESREE